MDVTPFSGDFAGASALVGATQEDVEEWHRLRPIRWEVRSEDELVALASLFERPDGRRFLRFGGADEDAITAIAAEASAGKPVYATVEKTDRDMLLRSGFSQELVFEDFEVRFDDALLKLKRAVPPTWCQPPVCRRGRPGLFGRPRQPTSPGRARHRRLERHNSTKSWPRGRRSTPAVTWWPSKRVPGR